MGKTRRRIPVIPVAFGIAFTLIVVIAIVLILGMNRESDEGAGPATAGRDGPASDRTKTGRGHAADASTRDKEESGAVVDGAASGAEEMVLTPTGYTIAGQVVDEAGEGIA